MDFSQILERVKGGVPQVTDENTFNRVLREEEAARAEKVARSLVDLLPGFEAAVVNTARAIKDSEERLAAEKSKYARMERAYKYFRATQNPLPYFVAICQKERAFEYLRSQGLAIPGPKDPMWSVPEAFEAA